MNIIKNRTMPSLFKLTIALLAVTTVRANWFGELGYWMLTGFWGGGTAGCAVGAVVGKLTGAATSVAAAPASGGASLVAAPAAASVGAGGGCLIGGAIGAGGGIVVGPIAGVINAQYTVKPGMNVCVDQEGNRYATAEDTRLSCYPMNGVFVYLGPAEEVDITELEITSKDGVELTLTLRLRILINFTPEVERAIMANLYGLHANIQQTALVEPIKLWLDRYMNTFTEKQIRDPEFFETIVTEKLNSFYMKKLKLGTPAMDVRIISEKVRR
jgi:hypothetical protein